MLLLLAFSRPQKDLALALGTDVPETPVEGIRFLSRPVLGDILVIENRRLPKNRPGYSVLRLMPTPRSRKAALEGIQKLIENPAVSDSTKEALISDLASNRVPSTHREQRSILDIAREEGRAEAWKEVEEKIARMVQAPQEPGGRVAAAVPQAEAKARKEATARKEAKEKISREVRARQAEVKARQEAEARLRVLEEELAALRSGKDGA